MERNVPKLRFKGFNDEWEEKKIGELYKDLKAGSTPSKLNSNYFKGTIPWITSGELKSKYIYSTIEYITEEAKESANLKLYDEGTLFIAITGLEAPGTRGSCAINKVKATTNQSCLAFQKSNMINNEFTYYWYNLYGEYIGITYTQGTKQQSLNNKLVAELKINIPSLKEQERIVNFLTKVDKIIEKQDEKVKNLEKYKKGMMQKIFSQEIRFKDENGEEYPEWEEKKLEQCFLERVEKNKPDLELLSVSISDGVKKRSEIESKDNSSDDKSNYKLVEQNDIVYNSMRMWQGASGVSEYKGIVSPAYTVLIPLDNVNSIYFSYLFKLENTINKFRKFSQGLTSDTWNLKYPLLKDIKVIVPCLNEQDKIARFLTRISLIIEEENNKLEELKQWKKGLLQQMFV